MIGLLDDVVPVVDRTSGATKTVVLGGGNAGFASIRAVQASCGRQVRSLGKRGTSLDPDPIPLLSLHRLVTDPKVCISTSSF